jgi:hypothetical protein
MYDGLSNIKFPGFLTISFFFREIDNLQLKHRCIRFSPHNAFFPPWVIFLGKFLNYKSLRPKEHKQLKMEAVSTSTESHNGVMLPKMEAIT